MRKTEFKENCKKKPLYVFFFIIPDYLQYFFLREKRDKLVAWWAACLAWGPRAPWSSLRVRVNACETMNEKSIAAF